MSGSASFIGVAVLVVAVITGFFAWTGFSSIRVLHTLFASNPWFWWLFLFIAVIPTAAVGAVWILRGDFSAPGDVKNSSAILATGGVLTLLCLVGAAVYGPLFQQYEKKHEYSLRGTEVETITDFHDRAPWIVAANYSQRDQGDSVGTLDPNTVTHVPAGVGESSRYAAPVVARGFMGMMGYSTVHEFELPKSGPIGEDASSSCELPTAMNDRMNAFWPWHSLNRSISLKNPFVHWKSSDVYAYCDSENQPVIVVPLWTYEGNWIATKVPAGAAVYTPDGLEILDGEALVEKGIEGPTFPASLAAVQRDSLKGSGSFSDWISKRSGYDTTDKDAEDSNQGNTTEFSLVGTDGKIYYVTPLTVRGSSQSIVAVMVVPAQQTGTDADLSFRIETNVNLNSTSSIENSIRSASVAGDLEWTTRWSAGMKVYEMVPAKDGHWVASIGLGQEVNYRADISPSGLVSIVRVGTPVQTDGVATEPTAPTVTIDGGKPLDEMTDEELLSIIREAVVELESRGADEVDPSPEP